MTLTFDDALQRAMSANESLKVVAENVHVGEARVAEAQAAFLPDATVNFQYLPWQKFPEIRIPAGVFGPEEQTFEAAFARQNTVSLDDVAAALHRRPADQQPRACSARR